ncbi:MAG: sigma factor G inhibitor Gin [Sporolactobacillus sp.]
MWANYASGGDDMATRTEHDGAATCLICGCQAQKGVHIGNQLICHSCQDKIAHTDVTDWKYKHFVNKLSALQPVDTPPTHKRNKRALHIKL